MKNIIVDFDNTLGVKACDVDDGFALLYLHNHRDANIVGVTTTFGNSDLETVKQATLNLFSNFNLNYDLKFGAKDDYKTNEAAKFLVEKSKKINGLNIVSTGSLTNLAHAYLLDNDFFERVTITCMGGITEDLIFQKKKMYELNFSCNYKASSIVFKNAKNLNIISANNCLPLKYSKDELKCNLTSKMGQLLFSNIEYYYDYIEEEYGLKELISWDVVCSVFLMNNDLFKNNFMKISSDEEYLKEGRIILDNNGILVNIPSVISKKDFNKNLFKVLNEF